MGTPSFYEPYLQAYTTKVLNRFDVGDAIEKWSEEEHQKVAFFRVVDSPNICHRSLILNTFREAGHPLTICDRDIDELFDERRLWSPCPFGIRIGVVV